MRLSLGLAWGIALLAATGLRHTSAAEPPVGEEQGHGHLFEQWAREKLFGGYVAGSYTDKWDVSAEVNVRFGGLPVSIKAARLGRPVDMGDALRQFDNKEDFVLLVGFWVQEPGEKKIVKIVAPKIWAEEWHKLWTPVTREELARLDALIKNRELDYGKVRAEAKAIKSRAPFSEAIMQVHPKIDSKGQRRLQCSLAFEVLFSRFLPGIDPAPESAPGVDGVPAPEPMVSKSRELKSRQEQLAEPR